MEITILGCGYLGSNFGRDAKAKGYQIAATTRNQHKDPYSFADKVYLLKAEEILTSFKEIAESSDVLLISVAPGKNESYEECYLKTAQNLKEAIDRKSRLSQIIYTSSTSVYGECDGNWVSEELPLLPYDKNSGILIETEKLILELQTESCQSCIFRLGEIYGPERKITERLQKRAGLPFPGSGLNYCNLIHLNDIFEAIYFAIDRKLSGIYNLCNDLHMPRKDLYEQLCSRRQIPKVFWDTSLKPMHGGNKRVCSDKLKKIGYQFKMTDTADL